MFGKTLIPFSSRELSVVLGLQYEGQLVNVHMHADSPFVKRVFGGNLMHLKWPRVATKLKEYATKNDSESIDKFDSLYTVLVLNTILLPNGNKILSPFVYPYVDDLDAFGYFPWGKSKHFEGSTIGLLAWVHERVISLGYATRVSLYL